MIGSGGRGQGYGGGGANGPNVANGSPAFGSFAPGSASPFASGSNSFSFRWPAPTAAELTPKAPTPMRFGGLGSAPGSASATPTRRKARTIWGDYDRKKTLGTGAYGRVYLAVDKKTGQHVAIKRTVMPSEDGAFLNPTTLREITILKKLKGHPNIVGFIDCRVPDLSDGDTTADPFSLMNNSPVPGSHGTDPADKRAVWLIMEYVETDLGRYMKHPAKEWCKGGVPRGLPMDMVKSFFFQILCGIAYCHANLVLHRDLKPCNILVTESGRVKLTDFGLGRTYNVPMPPYSPGVVTLMYRAPEICLGLPTYTPAVDVWSAGCILAEMLTGRILFNGNHAQASNDFDLLIAVFRILGVPMEETWPGLDSQMGDEHGYARTFLASQRRANYAPRGLAKCVQTSGVNEEGLELLSKLLLYNPSKRLTAQAALSHPWLAGVGKEVYGEGDREWLRKAMDLDI